MLLTIHAAEVKLAEGKHETVLNLPDPGLVRSVAWIRRPPPLVNIPGVPPRLEEDLVMFVELVPTAPVRNRRFLVLPTSVEITVPDAYRPVFVCTAVSAHSGRVAHVYEIVTAEGKPAGKVRASA
jgi:hypothetical protein